MTLLLALAILFGGVVPETATGWMEPQRLGISVGMTRDTVVRELQKRGHTTEPGKEPGHLIVPMGEKRTVTLAFENGVLQSVRFEFVGFMPEVTAAFAEAKAALARKHGAPSRIVEKPPVLQYEATTPRIYVVAAVDPATTFGKQGLGFLVIRYFAPPER